MNVSLQTVNKHKSFIKISSSFMVYAYRGMKRYGYLLALSYYPVKFCSAVVGIGSTIICCGVIITTCKKYCKMFTDVFIAMVP